MSATVQPESISDTRDALTKIVGGFRDQGPDAQPVVFGSRRRAEAVVLPFEAYQALLEIAEDVAIAQRVRERAGRDSGNRTSLQEVADDYDIELDDL